MRLIFLPVRGIFLVSIQQNYWQSHSIMMKRLSITRRGAALAGGTLALLGGGFFAADGLFIILALCSVILFISARLLGLFSLHKLEASIHLPSHVAAGVPFDLELTLHNRRTFLDAFNTEVHLSLPGKTLYCAMAPWTAADSASRIIQSTTIPGRGYEVVHHATLSTTFPLGLFLSKRQLEIRKEITITPRPIIPLELTSYGSLHDTLPRSGLTSGQASGEPRGIRPWQAGDSARRIHWPASARSLARGHGLRVREYDPPGFHPDQCHIVFHSYATGREMLREDRFERALSLLAGSLIEIQNRGIPCTLTSDFFDWQPVTCSNRMQVVDTLNRLARIRRSAGSEAHDLESTLRAVSPDHALMIISDMTPDSWQHLLSKHPQTLIIDIRQVRYRYKTFQAAV